MALPTTPQHQPAATHRVERPSSTTAGIALGFSLVTFFLPPLGPAIDWLTGSNKHSLSTVILVALLLNSVALCTGITGLVLGILGLRTKQRSLAIGALFAVGFWPVFTVVNLMNT